MKRLFILLLILSPFLSVAQSKDTTKVEPPKTVTITAEQAVQWIRVAQATRDLPLPAKDHDAIAQLSNGLLTQLQELLKPPVADTTKPKTPPVKVKK